MDFSDKSRKGEARALNKFIYMDTEITQDDGHKTKTLRPEQSFHRKREYSGDMKGTMPGKWWWETQASKEQETV